VCVWCLAYSHEIILPRNDNEKIARAMVLNRKLQMGSETTWHVFGVPFMISFVESATTNRQLHDIISLRLQVLTGKEDLEVWRLNATMLYVATLLTLIHILSLSLSMCLSLCLCVCV
jgi:hypothetical protein